MFFSLVFSSSLNFSNCFMTSCMIPKIERSWDKTEECCTSQVTFSYFYKTSWGFHRNHCIPQSVQMKHIIVRNAIPNWTFRGEKSDAFQLLTNIPTLHHIFWSLKCENPPDKTVWQGEVYNSVHLNSLWRLCLLLLGHVIVPAWVKATGFSHLLPFRGGDAERRVHLIIGLSASVFMLDFRFRPAHTLETAVVCVCVCVCREGWQMGQW